jgi:flavin-binding protein dodecin
MRAVPPIANHQSIRKEHFMPESVYKVIELVGTSPTSWEEATASAIEMAAKSLRDLRIAEVVKLDVQLENGEIVSYRTRVKVSFKYQGGD